MFVHISGVFAQKEAVRALISRRSAALIFKMRLHIVFARVTSAAFRAEKSCSTIESTVLRFGRRRSFRSEGCRET